MSFFGRAWYAAAEQYGRDRSEAYGRWAKLWRAVQLVMIVLLVLGIVWASGGPRG